MSDWTRPQPAFDEPPRMPMCPCFVYPIGETMNDNPTTTDPTELQDGELGPVTTNRLLVVRLDHMIREHIGGMSAEEVGSHGMFAVVWGEDEDRFLGTYWGHGNAPSDVLAVATVDGGVWLNSAWLDGLKLEPGWQWGTSLELIAIRDRMLHGPKLDAPQPIDMTEYVTTDGVPVPPPTHEWVEGHIQTALDVFARGLNRDLVDPLNRRTRQEMKFEKQLRLHIGAMDSELNIHREGIKRTAIAAAIGGALAVTALAGAGYAIREARR